MSGSQEELSTTMNLNAINRIDKSQRPWILTFSFARAMQISVLKAWAGKIDNIAFAQRVLMHRAKV